MNFAEYQEKVWDLALPSARNFAYIENGLIGEIGELYSIFAKATRDGLQPDYADKIKKELGDVQWFIAAMCQLHGLRLQDIADGNIKKLEARRAFGTLQGSGDDR